MLVLSALLITACAKQESDIPYWLSDYKALYKKDPTEASRQWFKDAKMGMFVHFTIGSLLEEGSVDYKLWMSGQANEKILNYVGISREDYDRSESKDSLLFTRYEIPEFDAEKICQAAVKAKMKYITFTAHHQSCNFDARHIPFNSVNASPSGRDLVAEMMAACKKYNLAPFFYMRNEYKMMQSARKEENRETLKELLTEYGPIAGLWFDGGVARDPERYEGMDEVNYFIKDLQPQCLVTFKLGLYSSSEDYLSPEFFMFPFDYKMQTEGQQARFDIRKKRWEEFEKESWEKSNKYKLREICNTMMEAKWRDRDTEHIGWINSVEAKRLSGEDAYFWLTYARYTGSNMLMSIGPQGDGSIHPETEKGLTELGEIIEERGWPEVVHAIPERPKAD